MSPLGRGIHLRESDHSGGGDSAANETAADGANFARSRAMQRMASVGEEQESMGLDY